MILKNISEKEQLTNTIEWKKIVKVGETFETNKGEELLRMYGNLFEEAKEEAKEEVKVEKKFTNKKK